MLSSAADITAPEAALIKTLLNQGHFPPVVAQAFSMSSFDIARIQKGEIFGAVPPAPERLASDFLASRGLI